MSRRGSLKDWKIGALRRQRSTQTISVGENRRSNRPPDAEERIVPRNPMLVVRNVKIRALVFQLRVVRCDAKTVCKSSRNEELTLVVRGQLDTHPLPKGRGPSPDINGDIKDASANHAQQLSLRS